MRSLQRVNIAVRLEHRPTLLHTRPAAVQQRRIAATRAADARGPLPRIALTLGDPAGIGPEVILKTLADPDLPQIAEVTLFASAELLSRSRAELASSPAAAAAAAAATLHNHGSGSASNGSGGQWLANEDAVAAALREVPLESWVLPGVVPHIGTRASGEASFRFLEAALDETLAGHFDAVVTGPVSKAAWHAAGHVYPGQTEYIAERARAAQGSFGMMFVARSPTSGWQCNLLLATAHIPLARVADEITKDLLDSKLKLLMATLPQDFGYSADRVHIAVAGLNPHSGEVGQIGREEEDLIGPWLEEQRSAHPHAWLEGPVVPDTMWVRAGRAFAGGALEAEQLQPPDAFLALYHDQGLIPLKMMAFDRAVNFSAGLPFVRTSPDHGTAFGLEAGTADPTSMGEALRLAARIVQQRRAPKGTAAAAAAKRRATGMAAAAGAQSAVGGVKRLGV